MRSAIGYAVLDEPSICSDTPVRETEVVRVSAEPAHTQHQPHHLEESYSAHLPYSEREELAQSFYASRQFARANRLAMELVDQQPTNQAALILLVRSAWPRSICAAAGTGRIQIRSTTD